MKYLLAPIHGALLTAVLLVLVFPRFNLIWIAPFALTPLLIAVARESRPGRRFLLGYAAGIIYWFGVCYWIQFVLSFHGGLGEPAAWAVFLLFCLAKAIQMGVFAWLAGNAISTTWAIPAVAAVWVGVEITHEFLGFAWLALGNAGIEMGVPLRLAPYTGVYGLSFLFAMMGTALALAVLRRPRRQLLFIAPIPLLFFLPRLPDAELGKQSAVLVQPNISESEQWTTASVDQMQRRLVTLSIRTILTPPERSATILVWPEVPAPLYEDDARLRDYVANLARAARTYFLLGVVARNRDGSALNSALLVSPAGQTISRYDKVFLVPFGEFVPWPFGFANKISTEISDFRAGKHVIVSPAGDHKLGTFICYESVFPHFVRQFAANGAEVLFNLSNDGYFGKSSAREQHLKIVRMRAAENRRWILRSTNDGITAAIDPAGRVLRPLPSYVEAAARTGFSYFSATTVYTRYGDWFGILCGGTCFVFALLQYARGWLR